ncbi:unnamed protein product [Brassica oleracea var. botrytis]|uniref:(rape) hypothetical protein n=1 Tax=Brassica napus TaxID=3708 RepID=A0A816JAH3_BRANA|nr:unnamed protein product [Brassica napus]CAF1803179.1 unnamed protein product [Brassica napus]CAF1803191.1 unnamed protein product [Brassica napus]
MTMGGVLSDWMNINDQRLRTCHYGFANNTTRLYGLNHKKDLTYPRLDSKICLREWIQRPNGLRKS